MKPQNNLASLKVTSTDEYIEQEYPKELLVKKIGLEGKVYFDEPCELFDDSAQAYEMTTLSP
ncbi:hypothetical protein [Pseudobacteriovorax antillogorgiicola]|uniref:hypothetical protein n=1 Tax=Pseudobacteriovorax antillogorgiicola TaxID=1513793 RepID=UPI001046B9EF|nr:hypothetical protein [Pseudobacteriovorax antillogorgiicola]